jgi:hypothetical protein
MLIRHVGYGVVAVLAILAMPTTAQAQFNARDFSGVWNRIDTPDSNSDSFTFEEPPMTPWAEKRYSTIREGVAEAQQARGDMDQMIWPYCLPPGTPRAYLRPGPMEVVQTGKGVYIIYETNKLARQIYLDGRPHPDGAPATSMGHSTGEWDGDTLVVETVGLDRTTWIDGLGHPHTEALRIEERFRRVSETQLEIDFLFYDSGAYTQPWGGTKVFELEPDWELMEYSICQDRATEEVLRNWEEILGEPW